MLLVPNLKVGDQSPPVLTVVAPMVILLCSLEQVLWRSGARFAVHQRSATLVLITLRSRCCVLNVIATASPLSNTTVTNY